MRFSIFATILAATCAIAAPAATEKRAAVSVSIGDALGLVQGLTATLQVHVKNVNAAISGLTSASAQADKDAAAAKVSTEFAAMTVEITNTIGNIGVKANGASVNVSARGVPAVLADLVKAIQDLVATIVNVVKAVLAVVNLAAILKVVTALLGAVTGLIQTLLSTVNGLLAALQPVLGGLLGSVNGILGALLV